MSRPRSGPDRSAWNADFAYTSTVRDGTVKARIPERYAQWIEQGTARIRLIEKQAAWMRQFYPANLELSGLKQG